MSSACSALPRSPSACCFFYASAARRVSTSDAAPCSSSLGAHARALSPPRARLASSPRRSRNFSAVGVIIAFASATATVGARVVVVIIGLAILACRVFTGTGWVFEPLPAPEGAGNGES